MLRITLSIVLTFSLATLFVAGCDSKSSVNSEKSGESDDAGGGVSDSGGSMDSGGGITNDDGDSGDSMDSSGIKNDDDSDKDNDNKGGEDIELPPQPYAGPAFRIDILTMESDPPQYVLEYEVTVPSGGYKLIKDDAKHKDGHLELYLTLQGPGPEDIVTMALVTFKERYSAATEKISSVDVYVKRTQHGVDNSKAQYALAASLPE